MADGFPLTTVPFTATNATLNLAADIGVTNTWVNIITSISYPAGVYLVSVSLVVTGATTAGAVGLSCGGPGPVTERWIPDANPYFVTNTSVRTLAAAGTFANAIRGDATLAGATAKRLETLGNVYAATTLNIVRLA